MLHEGPAAAIELVEAYEDEKPQDECGVYGIWAPGKEVAGLTYHGLHELQHRGQSGAGIAYYDAVELKHLIAHKGTGMIDAAIPEAIPKEKDGHSVLDIIAESPVAIGHTRYSTAENDMAAQPFLNASFNLALAHNGHIEDMSAVALMYGFDPTESISDSHLLMSVIDRRAQETGNLDRALADVLPHIDGAYCLTMTDGKRLIGARDPWGFHPLAIGALPDGKGYVIASESVAFEASEAEFVREIKPGEVVSIDDAGITSFRIERQEPRRECMYEYIYTARPDSIINGISVYRARKNLGKYLAIDQPAEADVVVGVPSSGRSAATGYAEASGIKQVEGLFKNAYVPRSFLEREGKRETILRRKLRPNIEEIAGKRIVLVDDSLIKGNVMKTLVNVLRKAGAKEVHVRISAPRYQQPCYMGMDTRDTSRLIAHKYSDAEICQTIGADSIGFNSVERVEEAVNEARIDQSIARPLGSLCTSCVTGKYPFPVPTFIGLPKRRPSDLVTS